MKPFVLSEGYIPDGVLADFIRAKQFMTDLPDATEEYPDAHTRKNSGQGRDTYHWSCHGITRALANILALPWEVFDGWFMERGNEHSWLFLEQEVNERYILDPYPIAALGGPILIHVSFLVPWLSAYEERRMAYRKDQLARFDRQGMQILACYSKVGEHPMT